MAKNSKQGDSPTTSNRSEHANGRAQAEVRAAQKAAFLAAFPLTGTILRAAEAADVGRTTVYDWIEADGDFALAFQRVKEEFVDTLEAEAVRRARDGVDEPVFGPVEQTVEVAPGKFRVISTTGVVGTVRKYSDRLMEQLLRGNRHEKYNIRQHEHTGPGGVPLFEIDPTKLTTEQLQALLPVLEQLKAAEATKKAPPPNPEGTTA